MAIRDKWQPGSLEHLQSSNGVVSKSSKKQRVRDQAIGFVDKAVQEARDLQSQTTEQVRGDLQPFQQAGMDAVGGLSSNLAGIQNLINDPNAQKDFVVNNPFFEMLRKDATDTIFNNQAARGKVGSGGTALALQNSFALLGTDLVNQNIGQNLQLAGAQQGLVNTGSNAATNMGLLSQQGTSNITDLITSGAQANAANILGLERDKNQRKSDSRGDILSLAGTLGGAAITKGLLSDRRLKENIHFVGMNGNVPLYFYNYKGSSKLEFGTMAQEVPHAAINVGGILYVDYSRL